MSSTTQQQTARAAGTIPAAPRRTARRPMTAARFRTGSVPYLFIAPGVVLFSVLILYPIVQAVQMSFIDWKIVAGAVSQFIGFDN